MSERPFFSIVIPYYNGSKTIENLLVSIGLQKMGKDIEVIISDDCSSDPPEVLDNIVKKFENKLVIKRTKTPYNFGPGLARECGAQIATGVWLAFADQDDEYIYGTLKEVKKEILECKEDLYVICNFYNKVRETGEVIYDFAGTLNWNHAKFYNLDNLWKKHNFHFSPTLKSHEDIFISSNINCTLHKLNREPHFSPIYIYNWYDVGTSLSHTDTPDEEGRLHSYFEWNFDDYVHSTFWVYIDKYKNGEIDKKFLNRNIMEVAAYSYFSISAFEFANGGHNLKKNYDCMREQLKALKEYGGVDYHDIYEWVKDNSCLMFRSIKDAAQIAADFYIPRKSFLDWFEAVENNTIDLEGI